MTQLALTIWLEASYRMMLSEILWSHRPEIGAAYSRARHIRNLEMRGYIRLLKPH